MTDKDKNTGGDNSFLLSENIHLVEVYVTSSLQSAYAVVGYLSTYDIDATIEGETLYSAGGAMAGVQGISVMVSSGDAATALDLLAAGGYIPRSDTRDSRKWYSPLPFMKDAPLWAQLMVMVLIIALLLGALATYIFLIGKYHGES